MRKSIMAIAMVAMIGIAFGAGITIGTSLTQEEFNTTDFSAETFEVKQDSVAISYDSSSVRLLFNYTTLALDSITDRYEPSPETFEVSYNLEGYYECRQTWDKAYCLSAAKEDILSNVEATRQNERERLDTIKTDYHDLTERDFEFTDEELNG